MIRPFTLICMLSAFGAGLYLYQSKHQAQMLDREIGRTIKATEATRDHIVRLRAEWALLNETDRLAELAKAHTSLQALKPTQFVGVTELASRLPAPVTNSRERLPVEAEPEEAVPMAQAAPTVVPAANGAANGVAVKPAPVVVAAEPKPKVEAKPEVKPTAVAEAKPVVRHVDKPVVIATTSLPTEREPARVRTPHAPAEIGSSDATAPGTVGAAVLRAMRAQNGGGYAPSAYAQAASAQPAYVQPAYAQPAYSAPAASTMGAPAASMLGGRALPPPVPFSAR